MNHLAIALFLVLLSFLGFGIFIYFFTPRTKLIKIWCIFLLLASLWALGLLIMLIIPSKPLALLSCRIANLAALFIPVLYIHFVLLLTDQYQRKKKILFWHYILTFTYSLSALIFPSLFVSDVNPKMAFNYYTTAGAIYYLFPFSFVWMVYYSLRILYQCYKQADNIKKNKLKYVFIGTGLGFIGGFTTFPLVFNIPVYPWGVYLVPVYIFTVSYAILKHHLMDINFVFKRSLVYSILVTCITCLYLLLVLVSERFLKNIFQYQDLVASLVTALITALAFIPLKNIIQNFVDARFLKGRPMEIAERNALLMLEVADKEKFKAVATMASGMAHEIKNPLTAIKTFSEYLPLKMNDPEFLLKFSKIVGKEADRINELVHQLLEFSKPSAPKLEDTRVNDLINEVLDFLNSQFTTYKINVEKNFPSNGALMVKIDPNQFRQVFLNLFINAIEAMPNGGKLTIETISLNNFIQITITDTGSGIPPEQLKNLFQPFHTTKVKGTGLGLSISKNIIENHNGKIKVESEIGQGTKFVIQLNK